MTVQKQQIRKGIKMKKIILASMFLFAFSFVNINAQTTSTRTRAVVNTGEPVVDNTTSAPVTTTQEASSRTLTSPAADTPVLVTTVNDSAPTTKGGQPVSGSLETTLFLAAIGLLAMTFSVNKLK